jgi:hypothetical protein
VRGHDPGRRAAARAELEEEVLAGLARAGSSAATRCCSPTAARCATPTWSSTTRYHERRRVAFDWLASAGIVPLGRFGRFEYDNSDQCVIKARAKAAEMLAAIEKGAPIR